MRENEPATALAARPKPFQNKHRLLGNESPLWCGRGLSFVRHVHAAFHGGEVHMRTWVFVWIMCLNPLILHF